MQTKVHLYLLVALMVMTVQPSLAAETLVTEQGRVKCGGEPGGGGGKIVIRAKTTGESGGGKVAVKNEEAGGGGGVIAPQLNASGVGEVGNPAETAVQPQN